ncbi:NACHT domain-containing protein [Streptomyces sp. NPDC127178]
MAAGLAGAVTLAWRFGLGAAATAAALLPTLAPAYLTWKAFQHDRAEAAAVDLPEAVDQVAQAVKRQWDAEARIRRVHDPSPLPVAWRAADAALFESWPLLGGLARSWPGGPPGDASRWPADTAGLAGADADIGDVFVHRVPTQRLVVLGEPGAGKSVLLIRLLQELLAQRPDGGLVPVLFSLASWDPVQQPLTAWLADQLRRSIPTLNVPPPPQRVGSGAVDLAQLLAEEWRILPLLDGFDELPPALHVLALDALNRALPPRHPVVVASRAAAYQAALTRPDVTVRLNGAAGIHLLPLTAAQAADYLLRDAGGPHGPAAHRWRTVIEQLGTDTPVDQALRTPLGLFLARTIYNPRPQTVPSVLPDPDELCDHGAFPTHSALVAHLFNAFIPAAYAHDAHPSRWSADQAHRAFVFLAHFLQTRRGGSPDLAWWELHLAVSARARRLALGLGAGLASGLVFGLLFSEPAGVATGFATSLVTGYTAWGRRPPTAPSTRLRWSAGMFARRLVSGLAAGIPLGLLLGLILGLIFHYVGALPTGLLIGLMVGLVLGLVGGLVTEKPDLATATGPAALLRSDRHTFRVSSLVGGLAFGLGFGMWAALATGLVAGFGWGLAVGLVVGPVMGLAGGIVAGLETAWSHFAVTSMYLVARREVPPDLMAFLADAHEHRGVLRQVGAVYQFRHIDLQRHLTTGSR